MPLPKGYTLDKAQPKLPAGYSLDSPQIPDAQDLSNVPGADIQGFGKMQTPEQAAGIQAPKLHKSSIDYGKVLAAGDVGIGAGKGIAHTLKTIGAGEYALMPKALQNTAYGRNFGAGLNTVEQASIPTNTPQRIGHGIEQAGEFLIPGGAEEAGAAKLASLVPKLGKLAKPVARVATSAISSGAVNAAQGGSPVEGALMGAGGQGVAQIAKAAAPTITGIAQGLKPEDYAKTGKAILEETGGIFPGQVRRSARKVLDVLNPELDAVARRASVKPNPVKALLPAPAETIPLHETPGVKPQMSPMAFPAEYQNAPSAINPDIESPHFLSGGEHPELSGRVPVPHGVLVRPFEAPTFDIPPTIPNRSVSLTPSREVAQAQLSRAFGQNEPKMYRGVKRMANMVETDLAGNPLPESVTPYEALELKRGVGKAQPKGSWSPESANAFKAPRTAIYKSLNEEFENAVSEARPLNRRINALIPATKPPQNIFWGHALGPAVGGLYGGLRGARSGGFEGAAIGAGEGALLGLAIPAGLNTVARGAYSPLARKLIVPAAVGGALQTTREKKKESK